MSQTLAFLTSGNSVRAGARGLARARAPVSAGRAPLAGPRKSSGAGAPGKTWQKGRSEDSF